MARENAASYSSSNQQQSGREGKGSPGGLRCTTASMATILPASGPPVQKRRFSGLPRQLREWQGRRSGLPSSQSSRNSLCAIQAESTVGGRSLHIPPQKVEVDLTTQLRMQYNSRVETMEV